MPLRSDLDIKQALRGVGETLRCSIGLAPNRYLAKLASDMLKPDGMTVLLLRDLPQSLYRLELRGLIGVNHAMERRITRMALPRWSSSASAADAEGLGKRRW